MDELFDELNPLYWFDKPLVYSIHAENRARERKVPFYIYIPVNSKITISPIDGYEVTFKDDDSKYVLVVTATGTVITVYRYNYNFYKSKKEIVSKELQKIKQINAKKYPKLEFYEGFDEYIEHELNECYM